MNQRSVWTVMMAGMLGVFVFGNAAIAALERKPTLAVVDFQVKGTIEEGQAGEIVAGLFGTSLSDKYVIVERQQISKILTEQKFQLSDLVGDSKKAAQIGKLLGADFIVVGTVSQLGATATVLVQRTEELPIRVPLRKPPTFTYDGPGLRVLISQESNQ